MFAAGMAIGVSIALLILLIIQVNQRLFLVLLIVNYI
jgi:hypothetical protein